MVGFRVASVHSVIEICVKLKSSMFSLRHSICSYGGNQCEFLTPYWLGLGGQTVDLSEPQCPISTIYSKRFCGFLDLGSHEHVDGGCLRVFFAKRDWPRIQRNLTDKQVHLFERCWRLFAVISRDGVVVTVGHLYRRRRPH